MSEYILQKRLTLAGLASLGSSLFLGPVGILGAAGIFAGKYLRLAIKREARNEYFAERNQEINRVEEIRRRNMNDGETPDYLNSFIERYGLKEKVNRVIDEAIKLYHGREAVENQRYIEPRLNEEIIRNYRVVSSREGVRLIRRGRNLEGVVA